MCRKDFVMAKISSDNAKGALGDCQYRHDWIDGKCNTCGASMEPFERIAELQTTISQLQGDLSVEREAHSLTGQHCHDQAGTISTLTAVLKDLCYYTAEANIPMRNAHSVRLMGKFVAARQRAKDLINNAALAQIPKEKTKP
jgi:hypothetical protein